MSKIAVISASPPCNTNTGMLTVELAAASLQQQFTEVEFHWFTFPPTPKKKLNAFVDAALLGNIKFKLLPDCLEEIYEYDIIFFWGDFLNARSWLLKSGPLQLKEHGYEPEETWDIMARCMLLRDAPTEVLERTIIFGGTILPDKQSDQEDENYRIPFTRLVSKCHKVWMREPISAARVAMLRNDQHNCLGVDAALLLPRDSAFHLPVSKWSEKIARDQIGLFVGSRSPTTKDLFPFVKELAQYFSADLDWLPWFERSPYEPQSIFDLVKESAKSVLPLSAQKKIEEFKRRSSRTSHKLSSDLKSQTFRQGDYVFGDLLRQLSNYKFVVTDTYHICINAWRLGVPAICLGLEQPNIYSNGGTLTDLKKYIFYLTYQATDLYFTPKQLEDPAAASRAISVIESSQAEAITNRIQTHAKEVKKELTIAMQAILKTKTSS